MKIDISKTPQANLLALVNAKATRAYTADQLTFGSATVNSANGATKNTVVTLTAVEGKGFAGTVDVRYNRLGLDKGVASPDLTLTVSDSATSASLLTQAAAQLGLRESDVEWSGTITVPADGQSNTATLKAKDASYLYVGTLELTLNNPAEPVAMDGNVGDGNLDGFDAA